MRLAYSITKTIAAAALALWLAPAVFAQGSAPQQPAPAQPAAKPPAKKKAHKAAGANAANPQVTAQKPSAKKPAAGAAQGKEGAAGTEPTAAPGGAHRDPFLSLLAMRKGRSAAASRQGWIGDCADPRGWNREIADRNDRGGFESATASLFRTRR